MHVIWSHRPACIQLHEMILDLLHSYTGRVFFFFFPQLLLRSLTREVWETWLAVKTEVKSSLNASAFSMSEEASSSFHLSEGVCSSFACLFCSVYLKNPLQIPFYVPRLIQFHLHLGFPDSISAHLDGILIFFLGHLFHLPLLLPFHHPVLLLLLHLLSFPH